MSLLSFSSGIFSINLSKVILNINCRTTYHSIAHKLYYYFTVEKIGIVDLLSHFGLNTTDFNGLLILDFGYAVDIQFSKVIVYHLL